MRQLIKRAIAVMTVSVGLLLPIAAPVSAADLYEPCSDPVNAATAVCKDAGSDAGVGGVIKSIINVLLFIAGIVSVVVIIVAGVMYATSAGDQNTVTKAKNALMYAVIGLVVALLGLAVVNWVLNLFA